MSTGYRRLHGRWGLYIYQGMLPNGLVEATDGFIKWEGGLPYIDSGKLR